MVVSVIMKTLNEASGIAEAIESVLIALERVKGVVIVADGGSSDRTVEIAARYRVQVVQLEVGTPPTCGIGQQLGFQYSREPFVCLMDGDMQLDPEFLPAALAYLEAHPAAGGVTGHVREINVSNLEFQRRMRRNGPEKRIGSIDRMNGGGLYRREAIEQVVYLTDRNLHGYEEFDLGLRLRTRGWRLHRLDRTFVRHYGHTVGAYELLRRRWRSGYLRGIGELLRGAVGKPHLGQLIREVPELRLWCGVYCVAIAMALLPIILPDVMLGLLADLAIASAVVAVMSARQRSLQMGVYAIVAWLFHAAAFPLGFFHPRARPEAWIESRILKDLS